MKKSIVITFSALLFVQVISFALTPPSASTDNKPTVKTNEIEACPDILTHKKDLSLTDVQITQIKQVYAELEKATNKFQDEMKAARAELKALYTQKPIDFSSVRNKIKQLSFIQMQMAVEMTNTFEKSYSILTAEQKSKLTDFLSQLKALNPK